jgi:hypothetical protein
MTTPHRATPEQWELIDDSSRGVVSASCLLELRARVEALEAAQRKTPMTELRAASAEARPAGLVERVAARIEFGIDANQDPEGIARAAIREAAAAARDLRFTTAKALIDWLEREAGRG